MRTLCRYILILSMLLIALPTMALQRVRTCTVDTVFMASQEVTQQMIDSFALGLQTDINSLFTWAFAGTGVQGEEKGKDAIRIDYTDCRYLPDKREGRLTMDVYVLGVIWGRGLTLDTRTSSREEKGWQITHVDFIYSGSAFETAYCEFRTRYIAPHKTRVQFTISLTFGRFFSIFITDSVWQNVVDWRVHRFVSNMAEESVKSDPR